MAKTALVLRHVAFEGLAGFAAPVAAAGYAVTHLDVPEESLGDAVGAADLVIVMGGPMGAYEAAAHPWIMAEIAALAARIAAGRPTLGICLGAQLIAAALGADVYPGPVKEVVFGPVALSDAGADSPLRHLAGVPVLHWHGDTFDMPAGVEHLAATHAYPNQAFRRGRRLLALQFHPEMGEDAGFAAWLDGSDAYLAAAGTDASALSDRYRVQGAAAVAAGRAMLREWLAGLADPGA